MKLFRVAFVLACICFFFSSIQQTRFTVADEFDVPAKLEEIRNRTVDDNIAALITRDGQLYDHLLLASITQSSVGVDYLRMTYVDPRVHALLLELEGMPENEASAILLKAFDDTFEAYISTWESAIDSADGFDDQPAAHGLRSILFLCRRFCELRPTDRRIIRWHVWHRQTQLANPGFHISDPDNLFLFNIYAGFLNDLNPEGAVEVLEEVSDAVRPTSVSASRFLDRGKLVWRREQTGEVHEIFEHIRPVGIGTLLSIDGNSSNAIVHRIRGELIPEVKAINWTLGALESWLDTLN